MTTTSDLYFSSVLSYLALNNVDKHECLAAINFSEFDTLAKGSRVSVAHYQALLQFGESLTGQSLFGFYLGQEIRTADYGVLGYLVESSDTLQNAITALLQYDSLVADIGKAQYLQDHHKASIRWTPYNQLCKQTVLRNMTAWVAVVRKLINPSLTPLQLQLVHTLSEPDCAQLAAWFKCPVKTNCEFNQIDFPLAYLDLHFASDNPMMHQVLKQLSLEQLNQLHSKQTVAQRLLSILMSKTDLLGLNQERIAAALNFTPRTLQRRLQQENTSYALLLDQERKRRCEQLLQKYKLGAVAAELGFNEQSSFNRAFLRWYGCKPSIYKKQLQAQSQISY